MLDPDGICPTLLDHKGAEPAIPTPIRTEEQRQLRKQGIDTFGGRQLLPRTDGVCNTITTVRKDYLLAEPLISGHPLSHALEFKGAGSIKEISPALRATDYKCPHCVYEPQVIGSMQANAMRGSIDGVSPCLTEAMGKGGGQIPMIVQNPHGFNKGGVFDEVAPTVTSSAFQDNNHLVEPCGCYDNQFGEFARKPLEGVSRTIKTDGHNAVVLRYKVRKLTPTECFRLMGVDDSDIEKLKSAKLTQTLKSGKIKEKPMPKTALYKMAGNSIVVDVLYHIFKAMFIDEPPKSKPQQLSLFD